MWVTGNISSDFEDLHGFSIVNCGHATDRWKDYIADERPVNNIQGRMRTFSSLQGTCLTYRHCLKGLLQQQLKTETRCNSNFLVHVYKITVVMMSRLLFYVCM